MYKTGEIVSCRIEDCAIGGYAIKLLPEGKTGFLKSTKIWPMNKSLDVAFVTEQDQSLFFTDRIEGNKPGADKPMEEFLDCGSTNLQHITDAYFSELAVRCGVDAEEVKKLTLTEVLERANAVHMGLELTDLCGSFQDNLLTILKVWQNLDDSQIAAAACCENFPDSLREQNLVSMEQFEIIKKGQALVESGTLTFSQFAVAYRDALDGDVSFSQSLKLRNWLPAG